MRSSILFLGTGGDSFLVGRGIRSSAGIILQVGDNQFHIDPGNGATQAARAADISVRATTAVLVTRNSIHHASGLNSLLDAMTYGGFDTKGVLVAHPEVINGKEENQPFLHNSCRKLLERYISLLPGKRVGINEVEIQGLKTTFSGSLGLKFFLPTLTIAYSGDTKYAADVVDQYRDAGILILNVPHLKKDPSNTGLSLEEARTIVERVKPKLTIITSIGVDMQNEDPIYSVREIQKATGTQVIAANDGLVINPISYAADAGQWTLQGYKGQEKPAGPEITESGETEGDSARDDEEGAAASSPHDDAEHDHGFVFTEVVGARPADKPHKKQEDDADDHSPSSQDDGQDEQKKLDDVDEIDELIGPPDDAASREDPSDEEADDSEEVKKEY